MGEPAMSATAGEYGTGKAAVEPECSDRTSVGMDAIGDGEAGRGRSGRGRRRASGAATPAGAERQPARARPKRARSTRPGPESGPGTSGRAASFYAEVLSEAEMSDLAVAGDRGIDDEIG